MRGGRESVHGRMKIRGIDRKGEKTEKVGRARELGRELVSKGSRKKE